MLKRLFSFAIFLFSVLFYFLSVVCNFQNILSINYFDKLKFREINVFFSTKELGISLQHVLFPGSSLYLKRTLGTRLSLYLQALPAGLIMIRSGKW